MVEISQLAGESFALTPELAYLLGVYLGDGYVFVHSKGGAYFQLSVIDLDFVEEVKRCAEIVLGRETPKIKKRDNWKDSKKPVYWFSFGAKNFCEFLLKVTERKTKIPDFLKEKCEITKRFLEGFLDSEGWFSKSKKLQDRWKNGHWRHVYEVGLCSKDEFLIDGIVELIQLFGVHCRKKRVRGIKGRYYFYQIFTVSSFVASGLKFNIARKQKRMSDYVLEYNVKFPSETGS